jgi:hypothetical protein
MLDPVELRIFHSVPICGYVCNMYRICAPDDGRLRSKHFVKRYIVRDRVTLDGCFGLEIGFTDHFTTRLGTTSNYRPSLISTLYKTPQHTLYLLQSAESSPAVPL